MSSEYGIIFEKEKCVQCHACEVACKTWNNIETEISFRNIKSIWIGDYPDVKSYYLSVGCMHCADPACAEACPENAITKRDSDGIVIVDMELCTGCQMCFDACPFDVPQYGEDGKMQKCDLCLNKIDYESQMPVCVTTCPTRALQFIKINREQKRNTELNLKDILKK